jgi:hypothetical protein
MAEEENEKERRRRGRREGNGGMEWEKMVDGGERGYVTEGREEGEVRGEEDEEEEERR